MTYTEIKRSNKQVKYYKIRNKIKGMQNMVHIVDHLGFSK